MSAPPQISETRKLKLLSVVAPVYNEELLIQEFYSRVCQALEGSGSSWCSSTTAPATPPAISSSGSPTPTSASTSSTCHGTSATRPRLRPVSTTRPATPW